MELQKQGLIQFVWNAEPVAARGVFIINHEITVKVLGYFST